MAKRKALIASLLILFSSSIFADGSEQQTAIANACKPYLQQYTPGMNPNTLPAAAQQALIACKQNGSCATETLSNTETGIPNCTLKLNALQPIAQIPPSMTTPAPVSQQMPQQPPAHPFTIGSPAAPVTPATPIQTTPQAESTEDMNPSVSPDNNTQPAKKQAPQNSTINWF